MNRSTIVTISILILIIALVAAYAFFVNPEGFGLKQPEPSAAQLSLQTEEASAYTDIEGNPVRLEDYFGRVLVVTSWASWCPDCAQVLPGLSSLSNEYTNDEVVILAINRAEPQTTAVAYLKSIDAVDGVQLVLDPNDRFYAAIEGFSMPETLVYDKEGNVVTHLRGRIPMESVRNSIDESLSTGD